MKRVKKTDLLLLAAVLLLAAGAYLLFGRGGASGGGVARIYVGAGEAPYRTLSLNEPQTLVIDQGDGRVNVVEVTGGGGVRMQSASCKNQNCVHQGELNFELAQTAALKNWIICLPNRVSVELAGEAGA